MSLPRLNSNIWKVGKVASEGAKETANDVSTALLEDRHYIFRRRVKSVTSVSLPQSINSDTIAILL